MLGADTVASTGAGFWLGATAGAGGASAALVNSAIAVARVASFSAVFSAGVTEGVSTGAAGSAAGAIVFAAVWAKALIWAAMASSSLARLCASLVPKSAGGLTGAAEGDMTLVKSGVAWGALATGVASGSTAVGAGAGGARGWLAAAASVGGVRLGTGWDAAAASGSGSTTGTVWLGDGILVGTAVATKELSCGAGMELASGVLSVTGLVVSDGSGIAAAPEG